MTRELLDQGVDPTDDYTTYGNTAHFDPFDGDAVPVTWSQEPPTEAGWWWRWSPPRGVELYLIEPELGDGPLWNATDPADDMMYPVSRTVSVPGIYWLPAVVPQPPEVGE